MAEKILVELKQKVTGFELEPAGGGCFELTIDGNLVYSKLETGEFPIETDLVSKVSAIV